ncbi:unnamed protein product, partial [Meganyctiphanes norvegica]
MFFVRQILVLWVAALVVSLCSANTPTEPSHAHVGDHTTHAIPTTHHTEPHSEGPHGDKHPRIHQHEEHSGHDGNGQRMHVFIVDFERVQTPFIIGLWIFLACLGKIGFHMTPKLAHVFPESCMLIVLGIVIGLLLFYTNAASVSPLTADVFFIYMLPPIILDAGYFMPNRLFFDHLGTILVFAVVGTIWNCLTIGISLYALSLTGIFGVEMPVLHTFLFSALISAVDPVAVLAVFEEIHVEEVLYILVFGESLLNDGVTVVLYHMFEGFSEIGEENLIPQDMAAGLASFLLVALGGTIIGIIWGFLTAFITRFTNHVRVIEPIFVFVMSYLAYLNAEIFHLSGILAITFCGITMKNYVQQNISENSQTTIKYGMKMLASSSETIIFMFLGVSTVHDHHEWNTWFVVFTIFFCCVYRVIGTVILSAVCNRFRVKKIQFVDKFVMSYGGLRGAVAFALVLTINKDHIPLQPMFVTATIAMVYFTVFVQGITIKPLVEMLGVAKAKNRQLTMNERFHERAIDYLMAGVEEVMGKASSNVARKRFKVFNQKYLMPLLVREDAHIKEPKFFETMHQIMMQEAIDQAQKGGNSVNLRNVESFAQLIRNATQQQMRSTTRRGEFNVDVGAIEYNTTGKDFSEAKFHHLLSDDYKPVKRHRGSTYKRHAVTDDELQTSELNNRNVHRHRRTVADKQRKDKKTNENSGSKNSKTDSLNGSQQNGSAVKLKNDYIEEHMKDNPAFLPDEDDVDSIIKIKPKSEKSPPSKHRNSIKGPTVQETSLPWKRYNADKPCPNRKLQRTVSLHPEEDSTTKNPTITESILPWKRLNDTEGTDSPVRQAEFPAWVSNKDYVGMNSPSNTLMGINHKDNYPSIRDIFSKRNSSISLHGDSRASSRRNSLKTNGKDGPIGCSTPTESHHQDPFVGALTYQDKRLSCHSSRSSVFSDNEHTHQNQSMPESLSNQDSSHSDDTVRLRSNAAEDNQKRKHSQESLKYRRRSSSGQNSLLNTSISEDEPGHHVIQMDPDGGYSETTSM